MVTSVQALGLLDGLSQVADISNDSVGQALASAELSKACPPQAVGRIVPRWLISRSTSI